MSSTWNDVVLLCFKHRFCSLLLFVSVVLTGYQSFISKHSSCLALLSFNNLCLFNLLRIVSHLIGLWSDSQLPDGKYTYGFIRVRVLAVFSSLVLMALLACCTLRVILVFLLINTRDVLSSCSSASNAFLLGLEVLVLTAVISGTMSASPIDCVVRASAAATPAAAHPFIASFSAISKKHLPKSWSPRSLLGSQAYKMLQEQLCPVLLLVVCSWLLLVTHSATVSFLDKLFKQSSTSSFVLLLDTVTAVCILVLAASYLWQPLLLSIRVLMQAVSVRSSSVLQRGLHRASTIDGVLELRHTNVWSLTPHCLRPHTLLSNTNSEALVCSVLVRLQRDADPATVVGQLKDCLQHCVVHLTVQVYKDEWVEPSTVSGIRLPGHSPQPLGPPQLEPNKMSSKISARTAAGKLSSATAAKPPCVSLSSLPVAPCAISNAHSLHEHPALYDYAKIKNLSTTVCAPPIKVYYQTLFSTAPQSAQSSSTLSYTSPVCTANKVPAELPPGSVSSPVLITTATETNPTSVHPSHSTTGLGTKKGLPSPHYVNVNLPPFDYELLNHQRTAGGSALQRQSDVDRQILPIGSKYNYPDGNNRSFTINTYIPEQAKSYVPLCNVSDDQKSNLNLGECERYREYHSDVQNHFSDAFNCSKNPNLVALGKNNAVSDVAPMGDGAVWQYGNQYELDEHAYVNVEFTGNS